MRVIGVLLILLCLAPARGRAQARAGASADSVTIAAGERYRAGALHRLVFGAHYRDVWATPIRVPVLDLARFAGGLRPTERGGGMQTKSLRFIGADGKEYTFRSVDKDPSAILPPELHETLVDDIIQDQISSGHPYGALIAAPILEAAGVLHAEPQLRVMPDDPRLGEFRAEFAGMLGLIEERPEEGSDTLPGFRGATNVVGTDRLLERLEEEYEQVDARAFLAARLLDAFFGDWDRHRDQWRWAVFEEGRGALWQPIPRDRDQAFVKLDGLLLDLARQYHPQLVNYEADYPSTLGLMWNGRELDRRLLVGLEWPTWDSVALALRDRLTDDVLEEAVAQLPAQVRAQGGQALLHAMRARRDGLVSFARKFYELLAGEVDIHTTDAPEVVEVVKSANGLRVHITAKLPSGERLALIERTFLAAETNEVRLFLHGGPDSTRIRGEAEPGTTVRVIGGGGDDVFVDATDGGNDRFYDADPTSVFVTASDTHVERRPYVYPGPEYPPSQPPQDWGHRYRYPLWALLAPDIGVLAGLGVEWTRFGFRQFPYATQIRLRAAFGTSAKTYRAELDARWHREQSPTHFTLGVRATGLDVLRFHDFGNETVVDGPDDFFQVDQQRFSIEPRIVQPLGGRSLVSGGFVVNYTVTDDDPGRLINVARPYGTGEFGQVGLRADVVFDSRDRERAASSGWLLTAGGSLYPPIWNVEETFGDLRAEAATYLSAAMPLSPVLAFRVGGRTLFGRYPYSEAAYIGDDETVRLGRKQRFGGDAEVHANAELRLALFRATLVLPAQFGIFGLADTGRVFFEDEDSDRWHSAAGGGIWLAFLQPGNTLSLAVARSSERTGIYLGAGFAF